MKKESRGYSIILFLIWPLSALIIGLRSFDIKFGRKLIMAVYAFLGFTALSAGDLQRYQQQFYDRKLSSFTEIVQELITLQNGKFYNNLVALLTGIFFESHHYYFLVLFLIYGILYINIIHLFKSVKLSELDRFGLLFFGGLLLFLFVRPLASIAFYTGALFVVLMCLKYHKTAQRKYLFFLLFAPLFHIGLTIFVIIPTLLFLFRNKTWLYIAFVVLTFAAGKSSVVGAIASVAESNSDTIIETKYKSYASEKGQEVLGERTAKNAEGNNAKLKSLMYIQDAIWYFFVPLGLAFVFLKRKYLLIDHDLRMLFHIVLLFFGISNLMINISQGLRFLLVYCFVAIGLFFAIYLKTKDFQNESLFSKFLKVFVPILFLYGAMATYASNALIAAEFFISNFFIEIVRGFF